MAGIRVMSCSKLAVLVVLLNTLTWTRAQEEQVDIQVHRINYRLNKNSMDVRPLSECLKVVT